MSGQSTAGAKVVVGSGWWCAEAWPSWLIGAAATRSPQFFELWLAQVLRCLRPAKIIVTDSAAPIKPAVRHPSLVWVELDRNYGHAIDIKNGLINTKYCGFTRSVMNGAMYALCCDADYYVYVEQDCILVGDDLLAHAIGDASEDILLGPPPVNGIGLNGTPAAPMLQQSLIVVRGQVLPRFIEGLAAAPWSDGEKSPEIIMAERLQPLGQLRIPYGRSRPIDFSLSHFYAQHLSEGELAQMQVRLRAPAADVEVSPT
jgi:hypothetical protein